MPAKRECYNCGRPVSKRSAIETVDYDLWGDPMPVWLCRQCYGAGTSTVEPAQPTLGFPDEFTAENAA
jgi:hypothetical protein